MERIVRRNDEYEILTPTGWSEFQGVSLKETTFTLEVFTSIGSIRCTGSHLLCTPDGFVEANGISVGQYIISKDNEPVKVIEILKHTENVLVFDALEVAKGHEYFTGSFVSHNCDFIGSSGTLIAGWALKKLTETSRAAIANDGKLQFFEYPIKQHDEWDEKEQVLKQVPGNRYALIADVSRGKGLDYSAFHVIDISKPPYKQVCVYRNNQITPRDYADVINSIGRFYNDAWCMIEINDIGEQVGDLLINELEYENVLCTESAGKGGKKIVFDGKKIDKGIRTTPGVKLSGCLLLKLLIEQEKLLIPDSQTIYELNTFVKEKNTYKAEIGKHDDLAMGLVLFAWLTDNRFFKDMTEINTMDHLREKTVEQLHGELSPLGFYEDEPATVYHEFYPVTHDMNNNWNWGNNLREYGDTIQIANF